MIWASDRKVKRNTPREKMITAPLKRRSWVGNFGLVIPERDGWSRLGSNQGPFECESNALPLSHATSY